MLAAGKAAGSMTEVAERIISSRASPRTGSPASPSPATATAGRPGIIPGGRGRPSGAGRGRASPAPSARSRSPTRAGADDLVLVLLSGGASANWIAPAAGLTLAEKQAVTRALLRRGAAIGEINTVRKHLSRIKGGRLARARASRPAS